ncbi:hypothetical protein FHS10_003465 [Mucilaginibacter dorajii]|nr:hypothetical protein [Mucilaginibacter dorajii]
MGFLFTAVVSKIIARLKLSFRQDIENYLRLSILNLEGGIPDALRKERMK